MEEFSEGEEEKEKKKKSIEIRFKDVTQRSILIPSLKQTALSAKRYKLEGG